MDEDPEDFGSPPPPTIEPLSDEEDVEDETSWLDERWIDAPCAQPPEDDAYWGFCGTRFKSLTGPIVSNMTEYEFRTHGAKLKLDELIPEPIDIVAPLVYRPERPEHRDWLERPTICSQIVSRSDVTAFHYLHEPAQKRMRQ